MVNIFNKIQSAILRLVNSKLWVFIQVALASIFFLTNQPKLSLVFFVIYLTICAIFIDDLSVTLTPFCLMIISILGQYGFTLDKFMTLLPLLLGAVAMFVLHFIIYPVKCTKGQLTGAFLLVSLALTLGGIGSITSEAYFSIMSLYYMFGLGFFGVLIYFIIRNFYGINTKINPSEQIINNFLAIAGMALIIISFTVLKGVILKELWNIQWSNNISALITLSIPFIFYKAITSKKYNLVYFFFALLTAMAMLFSFSRSGMMLSIVSLAVCTSVSIFVCPKYRVFLILTVVIALSTLIAILIIFPQYTKSLLELLNIDKDEVRVQLFMNAIENFLANPAFGAGLGYTNYEIYPKQPSALYWYHCSIAQIIGSCGTLGIIAYLYQFKKRMNVIKQKKYLFNLFTGISFLLFNAMCLVNPYDFVPLPYLVILMAMFSTLELTNINPKLLINEKTKVEDLEKLD